jgi:hypothetical protein
MLRIVSVLIVVALVSPPLVKADSDGYYCIGRGYIAYETRFSTLPSQHLLHVIRFSSTEGIVTFPLIALEDFQVHSMTCRATVIELNAWTTRYVVDIANPQSPIITSAPKSAGPGAGSQAGLGHWSQEGVIDLQGHAHPGEFQLVIARVSRPLKGGVEHYTITQLIRRDGGGRILASLELFNGIFLETID